MHSGLLSMVLPGENRRKMMITPLMMMIFMVGCLLSLTAEAWLRTDRTSFHSLSFRLGRHHQERRRRRGDRRGHIMSGTLSMDLETPDTGAVMMRPTTGPWPFLRPRPQTTGGRFSGLFSKQQRQRAVDTAAQSHGMPWRQSIEPTYTNYDERGAPTQELFYMPFWHWQLQFMKEHLTNLRPIPVQSKATQKDLSFVENVERQMRMHTVQFASDEYKCIRMTVLDAGHKTQVFTSLWTPNPLYNCPVLGVDLLQFNQKKHLCIVDFQPIHPQESMHDRCYEHLLAPIRAKVPSLQGSMTDRFYDRDQFFSKQMLLGRFEEPPGPEGRSAREVVMQDLMPAYQAYVNTHVQLIQSTTPRPDRIEAIRQRQAAYDDYSAARDPAHGLLGRCFGLEFADDYVHDVLFPLSTRPALLSP